MEQIESWAISFVQTLMMDLQVLEMVVKPQRSKVVVKRKVKVN